MTKYEGLQSQNKELIEAEVVMFYDGISAPIYCIGGYPLEVVKGYLRFKRQFEYKCMTYEEYKQIV